MTTTDTIVAISTPPGVGGIAVVRISGPQAYDIALSHLQVSQLKPRHATYCNFDDLDDVVAVYFPIGYTGEPTVEISFHGSLFLQQAALLSLCQSGARMATPGEFTLRAFLSGRIDLSQAEAVGDLINATTPTQHKLAVSQLRGGYAHELVALRKQLVDLTALLELELDFSEEDVEFANRSSLRQTLNNIQNEVKRLVDSFGTGNAIKDGIPVAIIGRPNAGKSSLLNALLHDDRAIVSPIPGTTRDTIEETINIDGITFRFIDTAGLRQSDDPLEQIGCSRTMRAAQNAKIILLVRDINTPYDDNATTDISTITEQCSTDNKHLIIVHNKSDIAHTITPPGHIISALNGDGIDELKKSLVDAVRSEIDKEKDILITNVRHYSAMKSILTALSEVSIGLDNAIPTDLIAVDLRDALYHLGTITGEVSSDELLTSIFSTFCIGK